MPATGPTSESPGGRLGQGPPRPGRAAGQVLVAGVGNLFLRDDGFGPEVVRRLAEAGGLPRYARVVDYGIRGMHLAYDLLDGYAALVLVDTLPERGAAGSVTVLHLEDADLGQADLDAHGMDPVTVLGGLETLGGTLPPTYVVGCVPGDVSEGIGLSTPVAAAVPVAMTAVRVLLERIGDPAPVGAARAEDG